MTDIEKLIKELADAGPLKVDYAAWLHANRATILSALRRFALAEKVVEAFRCASFYGLSSQNADSGRYLQDAREALRAYDGAKEAQ